MMKTPLERIAYALSAAGAVVGIGAVVLPIELAKPCALWTMLFVVMEAWIRKVYGDY